MDVPPAIDAGLFGQIYTGLVEHPTALMLAVTLVALGYLYRERQNDTKEFIEKILEQEKDHRATLEKILPIAERLTQSVEVMDRVTNRGSKD